MVRRLSQIVSVPGFHWGRQVNSGRVACACSQSIVAVDRNLGHQADQ